MNPAVTVDIWSDVACPWCFIGKRRFEEGCAALRHDARQAHELLHYAKAHGLQEPVKERLLQAYFEQGRHVGRVDDLVARATAVADRTEAQS